MQIGKRGAWFYIRPKLRLALCGAESTSGLVCIWVGQETSAHYGSIQVSGACDLDRFLTYMEYE